MRETTDSNSSTRTNWAEFLSEEDASWPDVLKALLPLIHPVDREAIRIWMGFWPLALARALAETREESETVRDLELNGNYRLNGQLHSSLRFLFGSRFWPTVQVEIGHLVEGRNHPLNVSLEGQIRSVSRESAAKLGVDESLLLGITAAAFMGFRQVGEDGFSRTPPEVPSLSKAAPDRILLLRSRPSRRGVFGFLKTVNQRHTVVFDENGQDASFKAIRGQDLSSAAASDTRGYRSEDPRRIEGPVPFQCRTGSCGFCWIGVLGGRERLSEISPFERKRLRYFGYDSTNDPEESHPPIRLACQAQCYGDCSIVIPPWNGVLKLDQGAGGGSGRKRASRQTESPKGL